MTARSKIEEKIRERYAHLSPTFIPDRYIQAKIRWPANSKINLLSDPSKVIEILARYGFIADEESDSGKQLTHSSEESVNFILKAGLGPTFISFWCRDDSEDLQPYNTIFHALDLIHKIDRDIQRLDIDEDEDPLWKDL